MAEISAKTCLSCTPGYGKSYLSIALLRSLGRSNDWLHNVLSALQIPFAMEQNTDVGRISPVTTLCQRWISGVS